MAILSFDTGTHLGIMREMFREYEQAIGLDLSFQDFEEELAQLPGRYAPPGGALLLAEEDGVYLGCAAMRGLAPETCEMKRLYVRPGHRGKGLGRQLASATIARAARAGYHRMCLDTLVTMQEALDLYRTLGFRPTAPYYHNPIPGALYLELKLEPCAEKLF